MSVLVLVQAFKDDLDATLADVWRNMGLEGSAAACSRRRIRSPTDGGPA
jgi:hypothetical protein